LFDNIKIEENMMIRFQLFRLRLFVSPTLFNQDVDRIELLEKVIKGRPSAELRKGYWWHIGNVEIIDDKGVYFALGRTTKSIFELYDIETRNFVIDEHAESPYTHAYIDFPRQVLAIAYKPRLAPDTKAIAKQLEKLLNIQEALHGSNITADIAPLNDPRDFLTHIKVAAIVQSFTAEVTLPNPFDSHEDFEKPYQRFVRATEGYKGKAMVQGDDLNREVIGEVAKACAAAGNDASARMKDTERSRFRTRHLKGQAVTLDYNDKDQDESPKSFLDAIRETYKAITSEREE
jgi:hypothetical protein